MVKEFAEFELPDPVKVAADARQRHPEASALADELRDIFGDGCIATLMQDGDVTTRTKYHHEHLTYTEITISQYQRMGELSAENTRQIQEKEAKRAKR